jgi:hypothetical protein
MADGGELPERAAVRVRYSEELGAEICARVAAGESVAAVCRGEGMPHATSVLRDWVRREPEFGEALRAAQREARLDQRRADIARFAKARDNRGRWSTYTPETGVEICARIADGQSLIAIAADPAMPSAATILYWARRVPEFADAYAEARQLAADWLADEAREVALATSPEWVWADRLKFDTIRWLTARLAPKKYVERLVVAQVQAQAAAEAPADETAVRIEVTKFQLGPNGKVVCLPPRNAHEEAIYEEAYGQPYDGIRYSEGAVRLPG